jgi:hypothetical protein
VEAVPVSVLVVVPVTAAVPEGDATECDGDCEVLTVAVGDVLL